MASSSSRPERDVEEFGGGFTLFQTLGDDPKGERLHAGHGLIPILAVAHDARQRRYFGEPAAVGLAFEFDRERHRFNLPSGALANKRLHTEGIVTLLVMMQTLSPPGDPRAGVRMRAVPERRAVGR